MLAELDQKLEIIKFKVIIFWIQKNPEFFKRFHLKCIFSDFGIVLDVIPTIMVDFHGFLCGYVA